MEGSLTKKTINNNGVEIEYYVSNQANEQSTLVLSMGVWESASRALPLITRLTGRHCIVPSYRGRGDSSTPIAGFDWQQHASDLAAVLENEPINKSVFLGFSKGVSYMLGYLSSNHEKAHGIIIIDYPANHIKAEKGYAQFWSNMMYNGFRLNNYVTSRTLEGIENESTDKEFYQDLSEIMCPVWVFRGVDSESKIPSNLTDDDILKFKTSIKDFKVIDFKYSGHMILDEELGKACFYIKQMLNRIDED